MLSIWIVELKTCLKKCMLCGNAMGEQSWRPRGTAVSDSRCAKVSSSPGWEEICLEYQFCQLCETKTKQKKKKKGEQTNKQKTFLGVLCYIRWQRCSHLSSHCACWEWCSETQLLRNCQTPTAKTVYNMLWLPVVPSEWPRSFSRPPPILLCFLLSITNSLSQYGLYYTILAVMIFYLPNDNTQWSSIWSSIQCVTMH